MKKQEYREPALRAHADAERRWFFGGGMHLWKITSEDSAGALSLFEDVLEEGKTTPLHCHPGCDEAIYVLEGELVVHADGVQRRLGRGDVALIPRGVAHALLVTSESARILCMGTPGNTEAFFRAASEPLAAGSDATGRVDFQRVRAAAEQTGAMEVLGPPPFTRP